MPSSLKDKQNKVRSLFSNCTNRDERYIKLIDLGKQLPHLQAIHKSEDHLVPGCQSRTYLRSYSERGLVFFEAESDAIISSGLASLLIMVYSGELPETIIKCPPDYLDELKISSSLSPNRANGLYSIHLRMKQDALKLLISH